MPIIEMQFADRHTGAIVSREQLLELIEKNNGPEGLDLEGKDFSGIRLGETVLKSIVSSRPSGQPVPKWFYEPTGGINLNGANLRWAKFSGADLGGANFNGADLRGAYLDHTDLIGADVRNAVLWDATLDGAILNNTLLQGANLFGANWINTTMTKEPFGDAIVQESESYRNPPEISMKPEHNRYWQGSCIYRALKASFDNTANFNDASWAYRKARRMEKQLAAMEARKALHNRHYRIACQKYCKYVSDQFVEILCDYGESAVRLFIWIITLWLIGALIYGALGDVQKQLPSGTYQTTYNAIDLLSFSLATMTTLDPIGLAPKNDLIMRFFMPLQTLLAITLTGLFGFVLGNRINRV